MEHFDLFTDIIERCEKEIKDNNLFIEKVGDNPKSILAIERAIKIKTFVTQMQDEAYDEVGEIDHKKRVTNAKD